MFEKIRNILGNLGRRKKLKNFRAQDFRAQELNSLRTLELKKFRAQVLKKSMENFGESRKKNKAQEL